MEAHRTKTGFTLIELLVVTAVIMILVSIVVFSVQGTYAYAMRLKCQHRMEQVWYACNMYHNENRGKLPQAWDFEARLPWYVNLYDEGYLDRDDAVGCPMAESDPLVPSDEVEGTGGGSSGPPPEQIVETIYMGLRWLKDQAVAEDATPQFYQVWTHPSGHPDRERIMVTYSKWDGDEYYWDVPCEQSVTAFCVLAFLKFGITPEDEEFGEVLRGAIKHLVVEQNPYTGAHVQARQYPSVTNDDGTVNPYRHHQHATVTMALAKAYQILGDMTFHAQYDDYWDDYNLGHSPPWFPDAGHQPQRTLSAAVQSSIAWFDHYYNHGDWGWGYWNPGYGIIGSYAPTNSVANWAWRALLTLKEGGVSIGSYDAWIEDYLDWTQNENDLRYQTGGGTDEHDDKFIAGNLSARIDRHGPTAPDSQAQRDLLMNGMGVTDRYLHMARWGVDENGQGVSGLTGTTLWYIYFATEAFSKIGGTPWENWCAANFDEDYGLMAPGRMLDGGTDGEGNPMVYWDYHLACAMADRGGNPLSTAWACLALEKMIETAPPGGGTESYLIQPYSFGYNRLLGLNRRTPAGDTVVLVDYLLWGIRTGDPMSRIAPRHGGRVNVLFAGGRVAALYPEELEDGMWTPEPGD